MEKYKRGRMMRKEELVCIYLFEIYFHMQGLFKGYYLGREERQREKNKIPLSIIF